MDEFNEAPHIVRERERRNNSLEAVDVGAVMVIPGGGGGIVGDRLTSAKVDVRHELLESEEVQQPPADLMTDLSRSSHVVV